MAKLLASTLAIVAAVSIGFAAGRWTAPENAASTYAPNTGRAADENTGMFAIHDRNETPRPAIAASKPQFKPGKSQSYATDFQTLQSLIALAAENPQLAMEKAQEFKGVIKAKAETAILEVWAAQDPNGAWNWVQSFQPGNTEQFIHLLEAIGRSDPRSVLSYAEKFAEARPEMRKDIYVSALSGVTQAGAYGVATEFLEGLDIEQGIKAELVNFVAGAWGTYEPQAAMQWLMKQPEELRTAAASRLSGSWADSDPQGATNFAVTMQSDEQEPALQQSFSKWLATDAAAATAWLAAEPNQKNLDPLLSEVATQPDLVNGQVKTALSWAEKVNDPELRLSTVTSILSAFKQRDPRGAAQYLQELGFLTEVERNQLRENLAFEN